MNDREQFEAWAKKEGFDTANTYDTDRSKWVWLNPMTTDLWCAWSAARATPAQPVQPSLREAIEAMDRAKKLPIWDNDVPHKLHVELDIIFKALCAQPAPSGIGNAIRAMPLPKHPTSYDPTTGHPRYAEIQVRTLLSEAAALAEQQGQKIAQDGQKSEGV